MSTCKDETRTALYRFYDDREQLLYAGITDDPWRRWREHVLAKPWYPRVRHQATTWYESERAARTAETRAIRGERPEFNIAGAVRPPGAGARRVRTEKVCTAWLITVGILLTAAAVSAAIWKPHDMPVHVLILVSGTAMVTGIIPLAGMVALISAPQAYRFGCWLNRNFGDT